MTTININFYRFKTQLVNKSCFYDYSIFFYTIYFFLATARCQAALRSPDDLEKHCSRVTAPDAKPGSAMYFSNRGTTAKEQFS